MASIGYVLSTEQFPGPELVEMGVAAENAGFDMIWTSDHFQPWMENQGHASQAWLLLAALGQRTQRIPMGTGVTCPSYRYRPAIVAQAFATLGVLYPGRIFLGIGAGEALNEQAATGEWGAWDERNERMVEAVELIRALWCGDHISHQGKYFVVRDARIYDLPVLPIPMYIAASGEEAMKTVGKHGDGLITDSETALNSSMRKAFEEGARIAGKDPGLLPIGAELFVFQGTEEEARPYAELWRFFPKAWTDFVDDHDPRSIMRRAEQTVAMEEVLPKLLISPDPQDHIDKIQELIDGGVTNIFIHSPNPDQHRFIDFYARKVLPKLQHSVMQPHPLNSFHPNP